MIQILNHDNQDDRQQNIIEVYEKFFKNLQMINEVEILPDSAKQLFENLILNQNDSEYFSLVCVDEKFNLAIFFKSHFKYYKICKEIICELKNKKEWSLDNQIMIDASTKIILMLNGEINMAFSQRKKLLEQGYFQNLIDELHFIYLLSLMNKKSGILWSYRYLVYEKLYGLQGDYELFEKERKLIFNYLNKKPRNYYAWSYYRQIFNQFQNDGSQNTQNEIFVIQQFCEKNIREYSAFHFLTVLINQLQEKNIQDYQIWAQNLKQNYQKLYQDEQITYQSIDTFNRSLYNL